MTADCNSDNCDNEKSEVEKITDDDQELVYNPVFINKNTVAVTLKTVFSYTVPSQKEIFNNLFSPPPELV